VAGGGQEVRRPAPQRPLHLFAFSGGRIVKVVVDVGDDAYVDLERELHAAVARD
jgi:hypothetical protein